MDILIIVLLLLAGIVLLLVELFLIPGFGFCGLASAGCLLYANYHAFVTFGMGIGLVTMLVSLIAIVGSLIWFMKSKTLEHLALHRNITSKIDKSAESTMHPGMRGQSLTRLALIGYAEIEGQVVEVKSADGFIDERTPIEVVRVTDSVVLVKALV